MKRITTLLLCALVVFALAGCGAQKTNEGGTENEITALFNDGYECWSTSLDEKLWEGFLLKDQSWDDAYYVTAAMTAELYEEYNSIDFAAEDSDAEVKAFLGGLSDVTVTDAAEKIPGQDELDAYIGMTMGEMEEAGFERTGYVGDPETGYKFFLDGPKYTLTVTMPEGEEVDDIDNYSENDLRGLKIGGVEFSGLTFGMFDE